MTVVVDNLEKKELYGGLSIKRINGPFFCSIDSERKEIV